MKKFNNYNNASKYADRSVLESFDLDQSIKVPPPRFMQSKNEDLKMKSCIGPGGRAFVYTSI